MLIFYNFITLSKTGITGITINNFIINKSHDSGIITMKLKMRIFFVMSITVIELKNLSEHLLLSATKDIGG